MSNALFELSVTCFIAATPAEVWRVMTGQLSEWWCPKPWVTDIIELDWRAGGRMALAMHGPNGENSPVEGIFLEVTPEKRFVFTDAIDALWQPKGPFMLGVFAIAPEADGTRYTASARHWSEDARKQHEEMGFADGWNTATAQLKALLETP